MLVLAHPPRGFSSPGTLTGFPLSTKTNISKFHYDPEMIDEGPTIEIAESDQLVNEETVKKK